MKYVYLFLEQNLISILACVGLIIVMRLKSKIGTKSVWPLRIGILIVMMMLILEFADGQMEKVAYGGPYRMFTSTVCYMLRPLECIFLMFQIKSSRKWRNIISISWGIYAFLFILNLPLHFIFYFNPDFQATSFGIIRIIVPLAYMALLLFISLSSVNERERSEVVLVCILALAIIIATLFEWLDIYNSERKIIIKPCVAVCYVFYYLFLHIDASKRDPLTNLLNRQSFYDDSEKKIKDITGIISIDMNDLKMINDTWGHSAGDEALNCIADIFKSNRKNKIRSYRIGGDEFVILCYGLNEQEIISLIDNMRNDLAKTKYVCAFGYAMRNNRTFNDTLADADYLMYKDKKRTKTTPIR